MFKRRVRLVLLPVALAAAAAGISVAKASAVPIIDFCAIAPATCTTTLPPTGGFAAWSVDTSYANSTCGRLIADIFVPAGTGLGFELAGGRVNPIAPITKTPCLALTQSITIYSRGIFQTAFTPVKTATFKGTWIDGASPSSSWCAVTQTRETRLQTSAAPWPHTSSTSTRASSAQRPTGSRSQRRSRSSASCCQPGRDRCRVHRSLLPRPLRAREVSWTPHRRRPSGAPR